MILVWATYRNGDMIEGRGPMLLDKVFMEEADAHTYINGQEGVFGRKAPEEGWHASRMGDWEVKPLHILESLEDLEHQTFNTNLERAYEKLTDAERQAIEAHVRASLVRS
jgi:hypothetical protein